MNDCLFCKIAAKQVDAVILYEDDDLLVFLDIGPIRDGHAQIIPKQHYETFEVLPPELASKVLHLGQRLARRMKDVFKVDRVAFAFTGNDVAHVHAHVVPTYEKTDITSARFIVDGGPLKWSTQHLMVDRPHRERIKALLAFDG